VLGATKPSCSGVSVTNMGWVFVAAGICDIFYAAANAKDKWIYHTLSESFLRCFYWGQHVLAFLVCSHHSPRHCVCSLGWPSRSGHSHLRYNCFWRRQERVASLLSFSHCCCDCGAKGAHSQSCITPGWR